MIAGRGLCLTLAALAVPRALAGDPAPGRHLTVAGEASGALAPADRGYFNDSDYGLGALRELRVSLSAEARADRRLALLGEVRTSNLNAPRVYALYLRVRPWADRSFDLQAGLIPPVFGSFPRRRYGPDNPLIGLPLGYQYLTTLRPDAAPATLDDMLRQRGSGWRVRYPLGDPEPGGGLPLASVLRWDTGVQARLAARGIELSAAVTQGTLGSPRVADDNGGKQVAGRVSWQPRVGLILGASGARGAYLDRGLAQVLPPGRSYRQQAWGADVEYSRGYWLVRGEGLWSGWDSPVWSTPLRARALSVEGRYKVAPGAWLAARADHLGFSRLGTAAALPWDAPVRRIEAGAGYALRRNLLLKAVWQHNRRDGGFVRRQGHAAAQLLYWF